MSLEGHGCKLQLYWCTETYNSKVPDSSFLLRFVITFTWWGWQHCDFYVFIVEWIKPWTATSLIMVTDHANEGFFRRKKQLCLYTSFIIQTDLNITFLSHFWTVVGVGLCSESPRIDCRVVKDHGGHSHLTIENIFEHRSGYDLPSFTATCYHMNKGSNMGHAQQTKDLKLETLSMTFQIIC